MQNDQMLELAEFFVETNKNVEYMSQISYNYNTNRYAIIKISDKFGSISCQLTYEPKCDIKMQQLFNLHYFLLRNEYFKIKCDLDVVSQIRKKLKEDGFRYEINCFIRSNKIYEYLDINRNKSQILYRKKLIRKFYFRKSKIIGIITTSFSSTFTVLLYENMNLYLYDIQNGFIKGPFILIKPQIDLSYSQFNISNNGVFTYYGHYLMKNFQIIKYLECIYVQFRDDSKYILLGDSQFRLQLYDLLNQQTVYMIYIPFSNTSDVSFTYFDFYNHYLVQDSIYKQYRIKFYINMIPYRIKYL